MNIDHQKFEQIVKKNDHLNIIIVLDSATILPNNEGRHYHLDMNNVPFILGQSTSPSHNVKSNVQNVRKTREKKNIRKC